LQEERNVMSDQMEQQLMRLLHGELGDGEAAQLRRRIETEPDLARRFGALEALWSGLELPPVASAGAGLRRQVEARLEGEVAGDSGWQLSPAWSRLAAAAALATGIGLGMVVAGGSVSVADEALFDQVEPSLAESYWLAMTADEVDSADPDAAVGEVQP
jgi:anti-sigma factor RsiW